MILFEYSFIFIIIPGRVVCNAGYVILHNPSDPLSWLKTKISYNMQ